MVKNNALLWIRAPKFQPNQPLKWLNRLKFLTRSAEVAEDNLAEADVTFTWKLLLRKWISHFSCVPKLQRLMWLKWLIWLKLQLQRLKCLTFCNTHFKHWNFIINIILKLQYPYSSPFKLMYGQVITLPKKSFHLSHSGVALATWQLINGNFSRVV